MGLTMATLTKRDLLDAIKQKIKRLFCQCDKMHLIKKYPCCGTMFYEWQCPICGKVYTTQLFNRP